MGLHIGYKCKCQQNLANEHQRRLLKGSQPAQLEQFSGGFGVMRDAQTAKLQGFTTGDGWFAFNLATNLTQV